MSGIGHNGGPTLEPGAGWRRHCWRKARAELLPVLPIEVVRNRVRRAGELGLDYRSYASFRAASGHDIVAFLFSTNALRLHRAGDDLPEARAAKLAAQIRTGRVLAAQAPLSAEAVAEALADRHGLAFLATGRAPSLADSWSATRRSLAGLLGAARLSSRGVVVVGATALEREWCAAARAAGYVEETRFFSS